MASFLLSLSLPLLPLLAQSSQRAFSRVPAMDAQNRVVYGPPLHFFSPSHVEERKKENFPSINEERDSAHVSSYFFSLSCLEEKSSFADSEEEQRDREVNSICCVAGQKEREQPKSKELSLSLEFMPALQSHAQRRNWSA